MSIPRDTVLVGGSVDDEPLIIDADDRIVGRASEVEDDRLAYDESDDGTDPEPRVHALKARVADLTATASHLMRGQIGQIGQGVERQIIEARQELSTAEAILERAVDVGSGRAARDALARRDEARIRLAQLGGARQEIARAASSPMPFEGGGQVGMSETARRNAERFAERYGFRQDGSRRNREIAEHDNAVAAAGFDPSGDGYWRELERRLKRAGVRPTERNDSDYRRSEYRGGGRVRGDDLRGLDSAATQYLRDEGLLGQGLTKEQQARKERLVRQWRDGAARARRSNSRDGW